MVRTRLFFIICVVTRIFVSIDNAGCYYFLTGHKMNKVTKERCNQEETKMSCHPILHILLSRVGQISKNYLITIT